MWCRDHIFKNGTLETLYITTGDLQLRIYNKTAEIIHNGKVFFLDLWRKRLPEIGEGVRHIWRIEAQIRRPVLKQFQIDSLGCLSCALASLWQALTNWASLRLPDDDNSARRSLHPLWELVKSAGSLLGDPSVQLSRTHSESTAPVDWYVSHILGCLVGLAARLNISQRGQAFEQLAVLASKHQRPVDFAAKVQAEAIRLGMNSTLPP